MNEQQQIVSSTFVCATLSDAQVFHKYLLNIRPTLSSNDSTSLANNNLFELLARNVLDSQRVSSYIFYLSSRNLTRMYSFLSCLFCFYLGCVIQLSNQTLFFVTPFLPTNLTKCRQPLQQFALKSSSTKETIVFFCFHLVLSFFFFILYS